MTVSRILILEDYYTLNAVHLDASAFPVPRIQLQTDDGIRDGRIVGTTFYSVCVEMHKVVSQGALLHVVGEGVTEGQTIYDALIVPGNFDSLPQQAIEQLQIYQPDLSKMAVDRQKFEADYPGWDGAQFVGTGIFYDKSIRFDNGTEWVDSTLADAILRRIDEEVASNSKCLLEPWRWREEGDTFIHEATGFVVQKTEVYRDTDDKFHHLFMQNGDMTLNAVFAWSKDVVPDITRCGYDEENTRWDVRAEGCGEEVEAHASYVAHIDGQVLYVTHLFLTKGEMAMIGAVNDKARAALQEYQPDLDKPILDWQKIKADYTDYTDYTDCDPESRRDASGIFTDEAFLKNFMDGVYEVFECKFGSAESEGV